MVAGRSQGFPWAWSSWLVSREAWIWVVGRDLMRGAVVDKSLITQPLDSPALGSNIPQGVPRRDQFGMVFIDLLFAACERPPPLPRLSQTSAGGAVADAVSKVGHVPLPHGGRERVNENETQLVDLDAILPVDDGVAGPERQPGPFTGRSAICARSQFGPLARLRSPQRRCRPGRASSQGRTRSRGGRTPRWPEACDVRMATGRAVSFWLGMSVSAGQRWGGGRAGVSGGTAVSAPPGQPCPPTRPCLHNHAVERSQS